MNLNFSTARPPLAAGACVAALLVLAACDGPPRPEPSAPPPSPEQAFDEDEGAYDVAEADVEDDFADEADDGAEPLTDDDAGEDVESEGVVSMDPIPNPGDERADRETDAETPVLEAYPFRDNAEAYPEKPEPDVGRGDIADAADPLPVSPPVASVAIDRMEPIPNPPERRRGRTDDGLLGAPSAPTRANVAAPPPMIAAAPRAPSATGPRVRVPIAPAASVPAPAATRSTSPAAAGLRPTPETATAAERPAEPAVRLDRAERDLRRLVEREARLDAPTTWTPGETREVRLRLPDGVAERLEQASAQTGGGQGARELSATLSGDGFRIDPAGPQSIDPGAPDGALAWRVTPERADPGPLSARVEAAVPTRLGERRTLDLGEVSDGRGGAGGLSMRTLGWILLAVLGGGLIAWLLGRRNGDAAAANGRRRNRVRAEQRRDRAGPLDLSPDATRTDPARS